MLGSMRTSCGHDENILFNEQCKAYDNDQLSKACIKSSGPVTWVFIALFSQGLVLPEVKKDWQKIPQNSNFVGDC